MTSKRSRGELQAHVEQLEQENRLLRQVLDAIPEGVQISTSDEIMIYYNRACESIENIEREACLGKKIKSIYSQTSKTNQSTLHRVVCGTNAPAISAYNQYMTNGEVTDVISSTYPFQLSPSFSGVFSILKDIRLLRQYFQELMLLQRSLHSPGGKVGAACTFDEILHASRQMADCIQTARRLAGTSANILLYGETGTGKELFAQSIHNASLYSQGPFVPLNCAAIPETLLETLLFGTEKGAFTGATEQAGLLEQAENGTFFLDEINSMSLLLQAKLLRVIETKTCRRVGGKVDRQINCRFLSATNCDPLTESGSSHLRQDLYYRLCEAMLRIPPLRQRKEDIPLLCSHFVRISDRLQFSHIKTIGEDVLRLFAGYHWPGNVRELRHDVEYCVSMAPEDQEVLGAHMLHPDIALKFGRHPSAPAHEAAAGSLSEQLEATERKILEHTLKQHHGNISRSAKALGLHRQALQYRLKKFTL